MAENAWEAKQVARRARIEAAADRAERRAEDAYRRADLREEASGIPLGQPILVGHHSERRHRRMIERAENAMRASVAESKRARDLRAKAAAVGSGGISADDPDAIEKLMREIEKARQAQLMMKAANVVIRASRKVALAGPDSDEFFAYRNKLADIGGDRLANAAWKLLQPDFAGRVGFPTYQLQNNGANIKRMEARLAQLQAARSAAEAAGRECQRVRYQGLCEVVENFEVNRLQIIFEDKPEPLVRQELKSCGFRWAPSQHAWQRQLNNAARHAAKRFLAARGITHETLGGDHG